MLNRGKVTNKLMAQSDLLMAPNIMKAIAIIKTEKSADPTRRKGAAGPILSKMIPPTSANVVVPIDPKKKAIPLRVPRM